MKAHYEDIVKRVCKVSNWKKPYTVSSSLPEKDKQELMENSIAERQGAIGVACVVAYLAGVPSDVQSMSKAIGVPAHEVDTPYRRLSINGIFSSRFDARNDDVLNGNAADTIYVGDGRFRYEKRTRKALCNIAGIASGYCGLRE